MRYLYGPTLTSGRILCGFAMHSWVDRHRFMPTQEYCSIASAISLVPHTFLAFLLFLPFRHAYETVKRGSSVTLGVGEDMRVDIKRHAR